jgi:hypothetical protein
MSYENAPEAKLWLKDNFDKGLLNRFQNPEEALNFVEKLYFLGALKVSVSLEEEIGGDNYYVVFIVNLPLEKAKCRDIYRFCLTEEENADILPAIAGNAEDNKILITWNG